MKQAVQGGNTTTFGYDGTGDRLSQTVGAATTHYVLDPAAGLTQVLSDGTNTYLYGNDRLAQYQAAMQYFGADGLGSVRQIYDASGQVVGNSRYDPFGNVMSQGGTTSVFAFAGEQVDATGLTYLRARYYSAAQGRFTTRDVWEGDANAPMSYNAWSYTDGNPVNRNDPSGLWWWGAGQALWEASEMRAQSSNVHVRIQAIMMLGRMDEVHAEYTVPLTNLPVDLLNSVSGEMWEIKPWDDEADALPALLDRMKAMNAAKKAGLLKGINPVGLEYNWNANPL